MISNSLPCSLKKLQDICCPGTQVKFILQHEVPKQKSCSSVVMGKSLAWGNWWSQAGTSRVSSQVGSAASLALANHCSYSSALMHPPQHFHSSQITLIFLYSGRKTSGWTSHHSEETKSHARMLVGKWQTTHSAQQPHAVGPPCCAHRRVLLRGDNWKCNAKKSRGCSNTKGLFYFNVFTVVGLRLLYTK